MQLKSGVTFLGAVIAVGAVAGLYFLLGTLIALGVVVAACVLSYVLAAVGWASASTSSAFGEFMRGWLVGLNTALNAILVIVIVRSFADMPVAIVCGLSLGAINLIATFGPVSRNGFYQGVIGWLNWVMPMSWLIVALGFLFYVFSFLLHAVTGGKVEYLRVQKIAADLKTGTFFIRGGLIANLNPLDTAFNMGNFSFVDKASPQWHMDHEAGHTLNLAAFGCVFHLIGALDENATSRGADAFSERLAESHATGTSGKNLPMWA
jgi:hypothetical protein